MDRQGVDHHASANRRGHCALTNNSGPDHDGRGEPARAEPLTDRALARDRRRRRRDDFQWDLLRSQAAWWLTPTARTWAPVPRTYPPTTLSTAPTASASTARAGCDQTDGNLPNSGDYAGHGNNQMLVCRPEQEIRRRSDLRAARSPALHSPRLPDHVHQRATSSEAGFASARTGREHARARRWTSILRRTRSRSVSGPGRRRSPTLGDRRDHEG